MIVSCQCPTPIQCYEKLLFCNFLTAYQGMHVFSTNKKVFVIHVRVETSFLKIKRIKKKFS